MKFYLEQEMKDLRLAFEEKVFKWPQVKTNKMFGCPCYQVNGKLFSFLVTGGVIITRLTEEERTALSHQFQTSPFQAGNKSVRNWTRVTLKSKRELNQIIPFIKKSYNSIFEKE